MANTKWDSGTVSAVTLSGSNLIATNTGTTSANQGAHAATADGKSSGKYYFELTYTTIQSGGANYGGGIGTTASSFTNMGNSATTGAELYKSGNFWVNNSNLFSKSARSSGDVIGFAVDLDNLKIWVRVAPSGIWNNSVSADPATNNIGSTLPSGTYVPFCTFGGTSGVANNVITANFGDSAFSGTVPSGFTAGWPDASANAAASQTVPNFSQTAAAVLIIAALAAQTIPDFSQSATSSVTIAAAASQQIPDFSQTAAAVGGLAVLGSQAVPDFAQTAAATVDISASADQTIPAFDQSSGAGDSVGASAAQIVPAFAQTARAIHPALFSLDRASTLARLITIGSSTIRVTDFDRNVTIGPHTWIAGGGVSVKDIEHRADGEPSSGAIEVAAYSRGPLAIGEAINGALDGQPVRIELVDVDRLGNGRRTLLSGVVAQITDGKYGFATIEVAGLLSRGRAIVTQRYGPMCRADVSDDDCRGVPMLCADVARETTYTTKALATKVNQYAVRVRTGSDGTPEDYANVYFEVTTAGTTDAIAPTYDPIVGNTTTDGTAVLTARNAWVRAARVGDVTGNQTFTLEALPDLRATDDDWYSLGWALIRSGPNSGALIPIAHWDMSTLTVTSMLQASDILIGGEWLEIATACNKTEDHCFSRFDNIINRRAETFVPGRDVAVSQA